MKSDKHEFTDTDTTNWNKANHYLTDCKDSPFYLFHGD